MEYWKFICRDRWPAWLPLVLWHSYGSKQLCRLRAHSSSSVGSERKVDSARKDDWENLVTFAILRFRIKSVSRSAALLGWIGSVHEEISLTNTERLPAFEYNGNCRLCYRSAAFPSTRDYWFDTRWCPRKHSLGDREWNQFYSRNGNRPADSCKSGSHRKLLYPSCIHQCLDNCRFAQMSFERHPIESLFDLPTHWSL